MIRQNVWFLAALWMALAFVASLISIWTGVSVALIEILVGVFAGNVMGIHSTTEWIDFLALLGSGVLTFLAGAEIEPRSLKANFRASGLIGLFSFGVAFIVVWLFAQFILGWPLHQAQIAGIALSTTSVAGCLRGDRGRRLQQYGYGPDGPSRLFHHRFRRSARARNPLCKLQYL